MSLLALLLALLALPLAILDIRIAIGCLVAATALALSALVRDRWVWLGRGALALVLVGAVLVGWEIWELRRPSGPGRPSVPAAQDGGQDREVLLPLLVERTPVTRLALLGFVPAADPIYQALEPQFIDRGAEQGLRIIGYRHDGHVDIYDDLALRPQPGEQSRVTGKGRLNYRHTDLGDPRLELDDLGRIHIEFSFIDVEDRQISVSIHEHGTRRPVPMNLLAPVGMSSTDPEYFPLFLLHGFDFIRTGGSQLDITIDGRPIVLEPFPVPVPVQGQLRSFAKYTVDSEIIAVFPSGSTQLRQVSTAGDVFQDAAASYVFDGPNLARILAGSTEFVFDPALDLDAAGSGTLTMISHPELGRIAGRYQVAVAGSQTRLLIDLDQVEVPRQRGLLYRLIVSNSSQFAQWPKAYRYEATINRDTGTIAASWVNERPGG